MYPVDFGNSTYMVTVPVEEVAAAATELIKLLRETNYRGIFSAEFKFDARDGRYKILEINARPWWFIEFAAVCGVDVCRMAYKDALRRRVRRIGTYRIGVKSVHPYFDLNSCLELFRQRRLGAFSWARSWIGAKYPVLSFDDPVPAFAWWCKKAWYKITGQT
jgi:predicted ATP-grasp superfamily ATP-dependent carboligase